MLARTPETFREPGFCGSASRRLPPPVAARTREVKRDLRRPVLETWERLCLSHDRDTLEAWDSPAVRDAVRDYVEKTLRK